jgi:hypothetical protein
MVGTSIELPQQSAVSSQSTEDPAVLGELMIAGWVSFQRKLVVGLGELSTIISLSSQGEWLHVGHEELEWQDVRSTRHWTSSSRLDNLPWLSLSSRPQVTIPIIL